MHGTLYQRIAGGFVALAALAAVGACAFRWQVHYWPGSHGEVMAWGMACSWAMGTFAIGIFFGLQVGAIVGAVEYFGSRARFTIFNSGFWMTFVLTDLLIFFLIPRFL